MKIVLPACVALALGCFASMALGQVNSNVVVSPGSSVTTTVQSPTEAVTTKVVTSPGKSIKIKQKDGSTMEMDSDNSVYIVYPDGARVTAPDGVHTLLDGTTVTVKDGHRIP